MLMLRGADPDGLGLLRAEVAHAGAVLAGLRRRLPVQVGIGAGIAGVEEWLRHQEEDLRRRLLSVDEPGTTRLWPGVWAAGVALVGGGRVAGAGGVVVLVMGEELDRYAEATAGLIGEAGRQAALEAGPLAPMVEDGTTIAARAVAAWGDGALHSAEVEAAALSAAGHVLERTGGRLLHALPG
jgi:hypothetical protein